MTDIKKGDFVFVYGTLRPGAKNFCMLKGHVRVVGRVVLRGGRLYSLGNYPGMVFGHGSEDVTGDLIEVQDSMLGDQLDRYEGLPILFRREFTVIDSPPESGLGRVAAHVYIYNQAVDEPRRIHSGNWLENPDQYPNRRRYV